MSPPLGPSRRPQFDSVGHPEHSVLFYSQDRLLLSGIETLISDAVENGHAAVCLATKKHLTALATRLKRRCPTLSAAIEQGRYLSLDVEDSMRHIMSEGKLDEAGASALFEDVLGRATAAIAREKGRVIFFGEAVGVLWARGNSDAVMSLEQLKNNLARSYPVSVCCGYSARTFHYPRDSEHFRLICREHSGVTAPEGHAQVTGDKKIGLAKTGSERLPAQFFKSDAELDYPKWQVPYRAAVLETDRSLLFRKFEIAEAAVLTRLDELRRETGHHDERHQLMEARRVLQVIKRTRLGFLE